MGPFHTDELSRLTTEEFIRTVLDGYCETYWQWLDDVMEGVSSTGDDIDDCALIYDDALSDSLDF